MVLVCSLRIMRVCVGGMNVCRRLLSLLLYHLLQVVGLAQLLTAGLLGDVRPGAGGGVPDRAEAGAGGQPPGLALPPGARG